MVASVHPRADLLVELSWEVCNKVGGIYTVLESKTARLAKLYPEYVVIGPYFKDRAAYELSEEEPPHEYEELFEHLRAEGIFCYYGTWQIKGEPKAILVDYRGLAHRKDELKGWFWNNFGIDSLKSGWEFEEPILWSWAAGRLIEELMHGPWHRRRVVSQHHEWMAGLSLLYLRKLVPEIRTVFTTHATMLGRSLASRGAALYSILDKIDPQEQAYMIGVQDKFLTEKACAHAAHVFTTVSEITSLEAEKLLGKKPDILLMNGFDSDDFPTIEETSIKHVTSRDALREFLTYYFYPYYHDFSLEKNLILCTSGRYEFGNKGMDVLVDSLALLNEELKREKSEKTVTMFFFLLRNADGLRHELLENKNYYRHIRNYVDWHSKDIHKRMIRDFITAEGDAESFFTKEFLHEMKKDVLHFKRSGNPPVSTHIIPEGDADALLGKLKEVGLDNKRDDKVKIVVYPCNLDGNDGLLNMSYYEVIAGCHFALFPSSYEPWGYTPLEAAALGVPTLTTDLGGFGRFIKKELPKNNPGIFVLDRFERSREEVVRGLLRSLYSFVNLDHAERVQHKINAKQLSKLADWGHMIKYYVGAHNLALEK